MGVVLLLAAIATVACLWSRDSHGVAEGLYQLLLTALFAGPPAAALNWVAWQRRKPR